MSGPRSRPAISDIRVVTAGVRPEEVGAFRIARRSLSAAAVALLLLSGAAARADDDGDDDPPHITARGTASARTIPDVAVLRLEVGSENPDAAASIKAAAAALAAVVEAAEGQGIAAADIEVGTTRSSRMPSEMQRPGEAVRSPTYRTTTDLRLRLHDPARVATVLAALVAKGASQVDGVDYALADPAALLAKLTGAAVADARCRAEVAAGAANVRLGRVLRIEPPDEPVSAPRRAGLHDAPQPDSATASVEVTYAIDP